MKGKSSPLLPSFFPSFALKIIHFNIRLLSRLCGGNVPALFAVSTQSPNNQHYRILPVSPPPPSLSEQDAADASNLCTIVATFFSHSMMQLRANVSLVIVHHVRQFLEQAGSVSFHLFLFSLLCTPAELWIKQEIKGTTSCR